MTRRRRRIAGYSVTKDRTNVVERLKKANVNVRVAEDFLRVSPSVFNDMTDIEKLLEALS